MNIQPVTSLAPDDEVGPAARPAEAAVAVPFADAVQRGLAQVSDQLLVSQSDLQGLALGSTENLHEVMTRLEESRIALQLMLQVRNRVLEAYQEVMRMQL